MSDNYLDVEFGGMGAVEVGGFWGSLWGGIKKAAKAVYSSKAAQEAAAKALNNVSPGAGDAFSKGMKLINSANGGSQKSLDDIKKLSADTKAGDETKAPAHQLLVAINEGRKEAEAEATAGLPATVGADPLVNVTLPNGQKIKIKRSKVAEFNRKLAAFKKRSGAAQRGAAMVLVRRPTGSQASPAQVQQAIRRVPPGARPALAQRIVQASLPQAMQPYGQPQGYGPQGYGQPQGYPQQGPGYPQGGYPMSNEQFPDDGDTPDDQVEPDLTDEGDVEFPEG